MRKNMRWLPYVHARKEHLNFIKMPEHPLANHVLSVVIFLNFYSGLCGSGPWQHPNLRHAQNSQVPRFFSPEIEWVPDGLMKALNMWMDLSLSLSEFFWVPHTLTIRSQFPTSYRARWLLSDTLALY